jgi:hypothetical protein
MTNTSDRQLSEREIKALQIAAKSKLTRRGNLWLVPSQAGHGEYQVNVDPDFFNCTAVTMNSRGCAASTFTRLSM